MAWYKTGTVSVLNGQTSVSGENTRFASNARVGDAFRGPDGEWYEVVNIASETTLGVYPPYQGASISSSANYTIAPMQGYVKESADKLRALTEAIGDISADVAAARASADAAALSASSANAASVSATASEASALSSKNSAETAATTAIQKASEALMSADAALASKNAAKISEDNAAASAAQAEAIAGDKQPTNAKLTAISNSILEANKILYATGAETFGVTDFTAFARTLVASVDAASTRNTLELVKTTTSTDTTVGSLLKVGDFGLGGLCVSVPVTQINSADIPTGFYQVQLSASDRDLPSGTYSVLSLAIDTAGASHQRAVNNTNGLVYERFSVSSNWVIRSSSVMTGATDTTAGTSGLVPAPSASSVVRYLSDRGDWREISNQGAGRFFGELVSLPGRSVTPTGVVFADGQLISNALVQYPDVVADLQSVTPSVPVTTPALWLSDPTKRLCWAYDSVNDQVRVPDWNGKSAGSIGPAFFRGDGSLGFSPGTLRQDQIQNITGGLGVNTNEGLVITGGGLSGAFKLGAAVTARPQGAAAAGYAVTFDASGSARTGTETFPTHGVGVWGLVLFGTVSNAGAADAAVLATSYANQQTQLDSIDFVYLYPNGGTQASPANVSINTRYTITNPWSGKPVLLQPELLISGTWQSPGWSYASAGSGAYGVSCGMFGDTIVVQTGNVGVTGASNQIGGSGGLTGVVTVATPCRVKAWRVKG